MDEGRTIVAIASPPGAGARGILRLSGPAAFDLLARTFATEGEPLAPGRRALATGRFEDGRGALPALCLWMPGPRSYTGEDVAELHLPGSPHLLAAALERLTELGARPARPGEFTRRAFLSGRLDLSRAEAVLALIEAGDLAQGRAAAALLLGGLGRHVGALRRGLEDLRALVEASLDFDESDTGHVPTEELLERARELHADLARTQAGEALRARGAERPRVVLAGRPNAGKSALFNALVGPGAALEDPLAGSTRDVLEATWRTAGVELSLFDTAGLGPSAAAHAQPSADELEARAQALARGYHGGADLVLWLVDAADPHAAAAAREARGGPGAAPRILVWSRLDLVGGALPAHLRGAAGVGEEGAPRAEVATSAHARTGLVELAAAVGSALGFSGGVPPGPGPEAGGGGARELGARHRAALAEALGELDRALEALAAGAPLDQFAEALRAATDALDAIDGRTAPEDLLDRIFARFCIGK